MASDTTAINGCAYLGPHDALLSAIDCYRGAMPANVAVFDPRGEYIGDWTEGRLLSADEIPSDPKHRFRSGASEWCYVPHRPKPPGPTLNEQNLANAIDILLRTVESGEPVDPWPYRQLIAECGVVLEPSAAAGDAGEGEQC